MGQVTVTVNEQTYTLACRDGDEARLAALAAVIDERAKALASRLGQVGEARLMLMVALLLADEIRDLRERGPAAVQEDAAIDILDRAASRLEGIAAGEAES